MPYVKVSRDKRGYETYYLLEAGPGHPHQSRPRVLFWFRTPPQVKVGREPFSEEIRQAIEAQHPDLKFDWPRLMAAQPPSLEAQKWRERRRLERAARQAAREADVADVPGTEIESAHETHVEADVEEDLDEAAESPVPDLAAEEAEPRHSIEAAVDAEAVKHVSEAGSPATSASASSDGAGSPPSGRRRRRRRRRGRRRGGADSGLEARGSGLETQEPASPEPRASSGEPSEPVEPPPSSDEV